MGSWVAWFCSLKGNEFFCEVDEDYIQDDFNLSGLSAQVPYYDYALELILDADAVQDEILTEAQQAAVEQTAEILYGLIHARFILTARGLAAVAEKFRACDFGRCPRVLCNGQPCLPVGLSDAPRQSTVKLYCPRCEDVYYPRSKYHGNLDGAYFGTTLPHIFLLTYPSLRPSKPTERYVPRVFGFKISPKAYEQPEAGRKAQLKAGRLQQRGDGATTSAAQQPAEQQRQEQQQQGGTAVAEDAAPGEQRQQHSSSSQQQQKSNAAEEQAGTEDMSEQQEQQQQGQQQRQPPGKGADKGAEKGKKSKA